MDWPELWREPRAELGAVAACLLSEAERVRKEEDPRCPTAQRLCYCVREKCWTVTACPGTADPWPCLHMSLAHCMPLPGHLRQQSHHSALLHPSAFPPAQNMLPMGRVLCQDRQGPAVVLLCWIYKCLMFNSPAPLPQVLRNFLLFLSESRKRK